MLSVSGKLRENGQGENRGSGLCAASVLYTAGTLKGFGQQIHNRCTAGTQQVHLKYLASRYTQHRDRRAQSRYTQIDKKEHSRELWRRAQTKHRLIKGHRQKYIKDISVHELICHPISDWGFLLASFDQQECWGGNDYNHNYDNDYMDCWQSWYKLQAKSAKDISVIFWQFCPDNAVK